MSELTKEDYKSMWELSERRLAMSEELRTGLALKLQSQDAVRDEALEAMCLNIQRAVSDYTRRTPPHLRDCDVLTGHIVRALKREPNAAGQDDSGHSRASSSSGDLAQDRHGEQPVSNRKIPHDTSHLASGQDVSMDRPRMIASWPAPATPDVESMMKRLRAVTANSQLCREAAVLLANLWQQIETLRAAHDLGWAHKECPNCGADMMTAANPPPPERP